MKPFISVIVPIYKVEKYLCQCLDSLAAQTYPNFEVILMDDGSPDNCPKICDEYATKNTHFRAIHQQHSGLTTTTRLNAIGIARGEFLSFVDGDDWVEPDYLSYLYELHTQYQADIAVCAPFGIGSLYMWHRKPFVTNKTEALQIICTDRFYGGYLWNKLYPKTYWNNLQLPPQNLCEDMCFNSQIFPRATKIVFSSKRLYHYRIRQGSMSHKKFDQKNLFLFTLLEQIQSYINYQGFAKTTIALQNIRHWEWVHCMAHYWHLKKENSPVIHQLQKYRPKLKWYFQLDHYFSYRWSHLSYLALNNTVSLIYKYIQKLFNRKN